VGTISTAIEGAGQYTRSLLVISTTDRTVTGWLPDRGWDDPVVPLKYEVVHLRRCDLPKGG
jgi:hypothetical protein